jgi:iron complex outermembrane recepter protein
MGASVDTVGLEPARWSIIAITQGTNMKPVLAAQSRILAAAVAAVLGSSIPMAQAAEESDASEKDVIAEVTVTGTRRALNIQEVPLNIAAVSSEAIEEQGLSNLAELSRTVPGLFVIDQGPRAANAIIVRGLNADSIGSTEALGNAGGGTVATYVGEIPLYVDLALEDIERVEVLLGPQGTLYGAGSLAGAIRYIPRRPQFDATSLEFRGNTYGLSESDGVGSKWGLTFNQPLNETLSLRASLDYLDDPGFIDNNFLVREAGVSDPEPDFTDPAAVSANLRRKEDVDFQRTLSGRAAVRWQPSSDIDFTLTYYHQDQEVGGRTQNQILSFGTGRYDAAHRFEEPNDRRNRLLALEGAIDLGFAELTSATGYSKYDERGQRDQTDLLITLEFDYEDFPSFSAFTREEQVDRTFNQEFRLVSKNDGPVNWIGGVFYNRLRSTGKSSEFTPHFDEFVAGGDPGVPLRPDALEFFSISTQDLKESAIYGEVGYQISEKWQATVGSRYYRYDLDTQDGAITPLFDTLAGDRAPDDKTIMFTPGGQRDNGFLFKFNTSYRFTDDVLGYVTVSEGFRIGNSNGLDLCDDTNQQQGLCGLADELQFSADETRNYELGLRTQWFDKALTLNGAIYYLDWKDPQLASTTDNGGLPITRNGKGAETYGLELGFDARFLERWSLRGSYNFNRAELTAAAPGLLNDVPPPFFNSTRQEVAGRKGDRLPGSPEQQGSIFATYSLPLASGRDLDFNYGIAAVSNVLTRTGLLAGGERLGGFALHSASISLQADQWSIALYGQNLFNKYAITGVRSSRQLARPAVDENFDPIVRVRSYAQDVVRPREFGLRVSYQLGL